MSNEIKELRNRIEKLELQDEDKTALKEIIVDIEYRDTNIKSRSSIERKWRPWVSVAMASTFIPLAVADSFGFMGADVNDWVYIMLAGLTGINQISRGFEKVKGRS